MSTPVYTNSATSAIRAFARWLQQSEQSGVPGWLAVSCKFEPLAEDFIEKMRASDRVHAVEVGINKFARELDELKDSQKGVDDNAVLAREALRSRVERLEARLDRTRDAHHHRLEELEALHWNAKQRKEATDTRS